MRLEGSQNRELDDVLAIDSVSIVCAQALTWSSTCALLATCKGIASDLNKWPSLLPGVPVATAGEVHLWHPEPGTIMALPGAKEDFIGQAVAQISGRVYRCGGGQPIGQREFKPSADLDCFDQNTDSWLPLPAMTRRREGHSLTVLDRKLYVCGGHSYPGYGHAQRSMDDEPGSAGTSEPTTELRSAECFDPTVGAWEDLPPMFSERFNHGAAALYGKLYVCGGRWRHGAVNAVEVFNPVEGSWTKMPPMLGRPGRQCAASLRGRLYSLNNAVSEDGAVPLERFDPAANSWSQMKPMKVTQRCCKLCLAATAWQGKLYVAYGSTEMTYMQRLDPSTELWQRLDLVASEPRALFTEVLMD
mmetsp:Transcript_65419/g.142630  ORF Transcript_65419/g.142630 Transcript_65419/m.142630 type:complete len:359 (-) Transcript_65419:12-1088(-)